MRKVSKKPCYYVKNKKSRRIMAKCTTKKKAVSQMRLLQGIKFNKKFRDKLRKTRKMRN
jgi:hypothetical protein